MEFQMLYFSFAQRFYREANTFDLCGERGAAIGPELPEIDYALLDAIARPSSSLQSKQGARNLTNIHCDCEVASKGSIHAMVVAPSVNSNRQPQRFVWRYLDAIGWVVSSTILALLPKCPVCLVAYVAIGTGVGLSVSTATYLRAAIVVLCMAALSFLAARHAQALTSWTLRMTRRHSRIEPTLDQTAHHCEPHL
jgi:hypothetical protein